MENFLLLYLSRWKKQKINQLNRQEMLEQLYKFNCSTLFLLSPLGLSRRVLKEFGFINCFLKDGNRDLHIVNPVLLLFKPDDMDTFQMFVEEEYKRSRYLVEDYDYIGGYVVLVYKFPEEFNSDFQLFLEGKYSKFSDKFRKIYPKIIKIVDEYGRRHDELSSQYRIIYKTDDWKEQIEKDYNVLIDKDQEYWSVPDMSRETLKIEEFKK